MDTKTQKTRYIGLDILRVISIITICLGHSVKPFYELGYVDIYSVSFASFITAITCNVGKLADIVFFVCSIFLIVDRKQTKFSKVLKVMFDEFLISVMGLVIALICGASISKGEFIGSFFPTFTSRNWFIPIYLIVYLLCPLINYLCSKVNKKVLILIVLGFGLVFLIFLIIGYLPKFIYALIFISAYLIIYLLNLYKPKEKNIFLALGTIIYVICLDLIILFYFLNCRLDNIDYLFIQDVLLFVSSFAAIFLIKHYKDNNVNLPPLFTKAIVYVSNLSLLIYLFHDNYFLRRIVRIYLVNYFAINYPSLNGLWIVLLALLNLTFGLLCGTIYAYSLNIVTNKLSLKIVDFVKLKISNFKKSSKNNVTH